MNICIFCLIQENFLRAFTPVNYKSKSRKYKIYIFFVVSSISLHLFQMAISPTFIYFEKTFALYTEIVNDGRRFNTDQGKRKILLKARLSQTPFFSVKKTIEKPFKSRSSLQTNLISFNESIQRALLTISLLKTLKFISKKFIFLASQKLT